MVAAVFVFVLPSLESANREKRLDNVYAKSKMTGTQIQQLFEKLPSQTEGAVVFAGNSLTYDFPLHILGKDKLINHGIPGAQISTMIYQTESLADAPPQMLFLEGGINDLLTGSNAQQVCRAWNALLDKLTAELPDTRIVVQSILPVNTQQLNSIRIPGLRDSIAAVNTHLYAECMKRNLVFADVYTRLQTDGQLNPRHTTDGVHLTPEGYAVWAEVIRPILSSASSN